nr:MAG TPA: DnaD like replication protein [Caudoviricetes sp.]
MTSDYIRQSIVKWCNDLSPALVKRALEIAVEENVLKFRYANAILVDWANKGVDTLEKALAENNRRQQPKQYNKPRGFVENLPDWANRPQQPKHEKPIDEGVRNDLAEQIAKLKTSKGAKNEKN